MKYIANNHWIESVHETIIDNNYSLIISCSIIHYFEWIYKLSDTSLWFATKFPAIQIHTAIKTSLYSESWSLKRQWLLVSRQHELKQHASVTTSRQGKHVVTTYETMDPEELELESFQHWLLVIPTPRKVALKKPVMNTLVLNLSISLWVKHLC